jgi:hypothetical protein
MTVSTLWNGSLPSGTSSVGTGSRTDGVLFTISSAAGSPTLTDVGFYVPSGETTLAGSSYTAQVWTTTNGTSGTLVTSQAGSGTFVPGAWNWITLASPVALSAGVNYVAGVTSPDMIQFEHSYWSSGGPGQSGMTSGPIVVPGMSAAPGSNQQGNAGGSAFPASSTGSWFGIDIMVATSAAPPASPSGLLMAGII